MNPFEMVVLIILIVTVGKVIQTRIQSLGKHRRMVDDPEAHRMQQDVKTLRDRVAVLERIATDKENMLEREIEQLRDR